MAFWKKVGEEYESPLIVTGTILFTPHQTAGFVTRNQEFMDNLGRRSVVPVRTYMERKGFILTPKFVFIDGRTGATLHTETMHEEILYPSQQNTPALSSVLRVDGQDRPELPRHPQHPEDPRHTRPVEVGPPSPRLSLEGFGAAGSLAKATVGVIS